MGNLAFQDVDLLLSDIQRSAPNREFLGLQSVQELAKAVQFIGWVGVVHKPMIGRWPLYDQTATRARSRFTRSPRQRGHAWEPATTAAAAKAAANNS